MVELRETKGRIYGEIDKIIQQLSVCMREERAQVYADVPISLMLYLKNEQLRNRNQK